MSQPSVDVELADEIAQFYADPLGHVLFSYPWGSGQLEGFSGPDNWAVGFMEEVGQEVRDRRFDGHTAVDPIQFSTASGHGIFAPRRGLRSPSGTTSASRSIGGP